MVNGVRRTLSTQRQALGSSQAHNRLHPPDRWWRLVGLVCVVSVWTWLTSFPSLDYFYLSLPLIDFIQLLQDFVEVRIADFTLGESRFRHTGATCLAQRLVTAVVISATPLPPTSSRPSDGSSTADFVTKGLPRLAVELRSSPKPSTPVKDSLLHTQPQRHGSCSQPWKKQTLNTLFLPNFGISFYNGPQNPCGHQSIPHSGRLRYGSSQDQGPG
ncbi:hypothetical protein M407DRAFT_33092 [Tulasnella calospora MUT 4182]|uniref:Uncharacterized protein n=1 Tax=Tulasnella calospora MUT 4182 TaxID=1051891 RepID=A0A0C3Q2W3_9AGAM|nr:hypothetical protein M407DRAFT_33092 [Tulasnella calospora MUT 4182]